MFFTSPNPKNFINHEINFCFYDLISSLRMNCISTYFDNIVATKRYILVPTCLRRHVMSTSQLNRKNGLASFWESHAWMSLTCDTWPLSDKHEMFTRDSAVAGEEANWISGIIYTYSVSLPIWTFLPWGPAVQHGHAMSCHVMPCHAMSCRLWVADPSDQWWAGCTPTHPDAVLHWNSSLALRIQSRHRSSWVPGHARSRRSCHSWS